MIEFLSFPVAEEKLFEKLSQHAKERIAITISAFVDISNKLVDGSIKMSLLKIILEKRNAFLDLLKIGKNQSGNNKNRV